MAVIACRGHQEVIDCLLPSEELFKKRVKKADYHRGTETQSS